MISIFFKPWIPGEDVNGKCSWKYNCPACKKKKEKNSKILLKDNLKFVCPKNSAW